MGAVEAGQGEEARAEQVGLERQPLVHEVGELVHLHADEEDAADDGGAEPPEQRLPVAPLRAAQRQHHEQRAEQQQRGAQRDQRDLDDRLEELARRRGPRPRGETGPTRLRPLWTR